MPNTKLYQIEKVEKDLIELKNGQKAQARILEDISNVLTDLGETMKNFSRISEKQIRHETVIGVLQEDSKIFKKFIENSNCSQHGEKLKALEKSDDSQDHTLRTAVMGFLGILATAVITYFLSKG
jgi:hypothetical protein